MWFLFKRSLIVLAVEWIQSNRRPSVERIRPDLGPVHALSLHLRWETSILISAECQKEAARGSEMERWRAGTEEWCSPDKSGENKKSQSWGTWPRRARRQSFIFIQLPQACFGVVGGVNVRGSWLASRAFARTHILMQIWLTFKNMSEHTHVQVETHTHAWGPELSAITAQWNIFRLERCRITLQSDDKYTVSTIIYLEPLPTSCLQTHWCKGRGERACTGWSSCLSQGCGGGGWGFHGTAALPLSAGSRKNVRSRLSEPLDSLVTPLFRGAAGRVRLRSRPFFICSSLLYKSNKSYLLSTLPLFFQNPP